MGEPIYKDESYKVVGCCMEVHRELGKGHSEVIYKDALQIEFGRQGVLFERERSFTLMYKGALLPHNYFADFVVCGKIILEAKAIECLTDSHIRQTLNYLAAAKFKLGLLVNFGEDLLTYKELSCE